MVAADSYYHRGGEPALLGDTIGRYFAQIVARFPGNEAVVSLPQQRRLSYAALGAAVAAVAKGLLALGYGKGDRIGIWSTNNIEWLLVQLATAQIGAVLVNINPAYRPRELAYALQKSQVQCLVMIPRFRASDYVAMLGELLPELTSGGQALPTPTFPDLRRVILYDPQDASGSVRPAAGFTLWQEMLAAGAAVDDARLQQAGAALDRDDPINIQYTSGTTGFPKAVLLSHHNILNNAWFSAQAMHFTEQDRLAVSVPFYHCFGMVLANLLCLSVGACIVIPCEHFDAGAVLAAIASERCSAVHGVPTMFIAMLEHPRFGACDLRSLRTGIMAGAPCPPPLLEKVIADLHCGEILIGYGQTEASPITHLTTREDDTQRRLQTVGRNLPHQEVKIVDIASAATVPLGVTGEVCFRGYHVMRGYYGDAAATARALDAAGWLHSGDLGVMDAEGYVRITGRLKDMIIRGGENIYPREIEDFLFTHPAVAAVAVFGVPDDFFGEEVAAWVQLHAGAALTAAELRVWCQGRIAHFKIPKYIEFVNEFPMTVTGKLQKYRMQELFAQQHPQTKRQYSKKG